VLARRITLAAAAAVVGTVVVAMVAAQAAGNGAVDLVHRVHLLLIVACGTTDGLVLCQRPDDPVGALLLGSAACFAAYEANGRIALLLPEGPLAAALAWPATWLWAPANPLLTTAPVHFPDGRPGRAWRCRALAALAAVLGALRPGADMQLGVPHRPIPLGVPGLAPAADTAALLLSVWSVLLVTITATTVALLHGACTAAPRSVCRQQAQWLVVIARLAAGLTVDYPDLVWLVRDLASELVSVTAGAVLPVVLAMVIIRHRLLNIERFISRTAVLVLLFVTVLSPYFMDVTAARALLDSVLGDAVKLPVALVGVRAAAVLLALLRTTNQRRIDWLLYGERGNPYAVLARLSYELELVSNAGSLLAVDWTAGPHRPCRVGLERDDPGARRREGHPVPMTRTADLADELFALLHHRNPVPASLLGVPGHDHQLPAPSSTRWRSRTRPRRLLPTVSYCSPALEIY
jgi:hypothetical protein